MRKKIVFGAFVLILSCCVSAFAETTIKAEVDKKRISTDEAVTYKLIVSSTEKDIPQPQLPGFEGFATVSSAQSSTISFMQGGPKTILILACILAPLNTGKFTIQPSSITVQGKTYSSEAFDIEVVQGKTMPQPETKEPQTTL
jgi:hypothetical protein